MKVKIYIGFDPKEVEAYDVLVQSLKTFNPDIQYQPIILSHMEEQGLYTRSYHIEDGVMIDDISKHSCATEFAISRFLTLHLAREEDIDYAVFMDSDMLVSCDMERYVQGLAEETPDAPVFCVKHDHNPSESVKMDGQVQSRYGMKNWSSFVVYSVKNPLNNALDLEMVNTKRGIELHQFCWIDDLEQISPLPIDANFLVGYYTKTSRKPINIHYTEGIPTMDGYGDCDYSELWWGYYNEIYK